MDSLGKSIERLKNYGAKFAFWSIMVVIALFVVLFFLVEIDKMSKTMLIIAVLAFACLGVYMFFKAESEVDVREHGIYVKNITKKHDILYDDIATFDRARRIGKRGYVVIVYYLLVIVKKNGERITLPFRISKEFFDRLIKISDHKI